MSKLTKEDLVEVTAAFPEFLGYYVSRDGRAFSARRGGLLELACPVEKRIGYKRLTMYSGKTVRKVFVHQLICAVFHGPKAPGQVVRHLNGNPLDNRAENLAWGTRSENEKDKLEHGTSQAARVGILSALTQYGTGNKCRYREKIRRWTVDLKVGGRRRYIGCYKTKAEAEAAHSKAVEQYRSEHEAITYAKLAALPKEKG